LKPRVRGEYGAGEPKGRRARHRHRRGAPRTLPLQPLQPLHCIAATESSEHDVRATPTTLQALLLRQPDVILCLGVFIAEELFGKSIPVLSLGTEGFDAIADADYVYVEGSTVHYTTGGEAKIGASRKAPRRPAHARVSGRGHRGAALPNVLCPPHPRRVAVCCQPPLPLCCLLPPHADASAQPRARCAQPPAHLHPPRTQTHANTRTHTHNTLIACCCRAQRRRKSKARRRTSSSTRRASC